MSTIPPIVPELLEFCATAPATSGLIERVTTVLRTSLDCQRVRLLVLQDSGQGQLVTCDAGGMHTANVAIADWKSALDGTEPQRREAALLVPLRHGQRVLGVLELDPCAESEHWREIAATLGIIIENANLRQRLAELSARVDQEMPYLRETVKNQGGLRSLTGAGAAMKAVRLAIQQVAQTDSTALIHGETGTGKELVAQAIHQLSGRRDHLLVKVNCAALNPNILTSELFGHERGAFTGATRQRLGRFEMAQRGTIFLDEIAEIPPATQVLLLRVLQERTIERVGGNESIAVDVRVIAATHQDLAALVNEGRFRADLFFRLNVFPIRMPPLRERCEDIADLVQHFIHVFNRRMNKQVQGVQADSLQHLLRYHWPGNVRELENLIERMMIVASGNLLTVDPNWLAAPPVPVKRAGTLREVERGRIVAALQQSGGRVYGAGGAADILGLKPTTLYSKMRKLGISKSATDDE